MMSLANLLLLTLILLFFQTGKASEIEFSIIKTASAFTSEAAIMEGGELTKKIAVNHSAILIRNGQKTILFDTGLGKNIDQQFGQDMPFWAKSLFSYQNLNLAVEQIAFHSKEAIDQIFLSHVHWDHASGIEDFPKSCIAVPTNELQELVTTKPPVTLPSQFVNIPKSRWCSFEWIKVAYSNFDMSYDIFGDGKAILVPLPGHTVGSVGLFLNTKSKRYFFVGDLTWSLKALKLGKMKFWLSSKIVDGSRVGVKETLLKVKQLLVSDPSLMIVPSHDSVVQDQIGYYPVWVK